MKNKIRRRIKQTISVVLSAALIFTTALPAWAADGSVPVQDTIQETEKADNSGADEKILSGGYIADRFSEKTENREDTGEWVQSGTEEDSDGFKADTAENDGLLKTSVQDIPSNYRTEKLPAVRDQGAYGTCWAFSTLACMEINLLKKGYEELDLSELQLAYFATHSVNDKLGGFTGDEYTYTDTDVNYLWCGGNYDMAVNTLSDWLSAVKEESVPYETVADVLESGLPDDMAYADVVHLQNYRSFNMANTEEVKQAVMDYGAVGISYYAYTYSGYAGNQYYNADTAAYYCYDTMGTNHAVTVVGWDDDYSADNFVQTPEGNGAWIVRNSWSSDFGEDGYFYLSYYDKSLSGSAVAFEAEPGDNYDNNYQYDGSAFSMMTGMNQFKAANVFTAKANTDGKETIEAASFEVMAKALDYTVSVYTDITDMSNPESGTLQAKKSGSFTSEDRNNLLKTVVFDEPVTVEQGQTFSIVTEFQSSGTSSTMIYYDRALERNGISANCAASEHQSYLYSAYMGWMDFGAQNNSNFHIKAFTKNVAEPDDPDTPDSPDTPENPDTPGEPDIPESPDEPTVPDDPVKNGWYEENGEKYWYENGIKQGLEGRGKEIYDPGSDAWYWLDAVDGGKMAVSKDVYQESYAGAYADRADGTGKWVRYDENGHMVKGEQEQNGAWYRFDEQTGAMVKGFYGQYYYDKTTGQKVFGAYTIDGVPYAFDDTTGEALDCRWYEIDGNEYWYENGKRQGLEGRGKEICDAFGMWYWLDAIDNGKKAVSKDVYQESYAGQFAENADGTGKWVRYDERGCMVKGWWKQDGHEFFFDEQTGAMAKGTVVLGGVTYVFDSTTGILLSWYK